MIDCENCGTEIVGANKLGHKLCLLCGFEKLGLSVKTLCKPKMWECA